MGASKYDARAYPAPDANPHQREKLQQAHDRLRAELAAEIECRQKMAAEALRSLESEKAAWAEVHKLRSALVGSIHGECLGRPPAEDCWCRATTRRPDWKACNAARRALPPELLAMLAARYERERAFSRLAGQVVERRKAGAGDEAIATLVGRLDALWALMATDEKERYAKLYARAAARGEA